MVKTNIREILVLSELRLLKFQYTISPDLLDQIIFTEMTEEQRKWATTIATEIPSSSSSIEEEIAWDLFLTDSKLCLEIEVLLNKLKIEYEIIDRLHYFAVSCSINYIVITFFLIMTWLTLFLRAQFYSLFCFFFSSTRF